MQIKKHYYMGPQIAACRSNPAHQPFLFSP